MHTEITLNLMDEVTVALGKSLRDFQEKTCSAYETRELRREAGARRKRQAKTAAAKSVEKEGEVPGADTNTGNAGPSKEAVEPPAKKPPGKRKRATKHSGTASKKKQPANPEDPGFLSDRLTRLKKSLNMNTYKNHSLGDYTETIRKYGTTDSYSTEAVCTQYFQPPGLILAHFSLF